jgi:hypothetical protein
VGFIGRRPRLAGRLAFIWLGSHDSRLGVVRTHRRDQCSRLMYCSRSTLERRLRRASAAILNLASAASRDSPTAGRRLTAKCLMPYAATSRTGPTIDSSIRSLADIDVVTRRGERSRRAVATLSDLFSSEGSRAFLPRSDDTLTTSDLNLAAHRLRVRLGGEIDIATVTDASSGVVDAQPWPVASSRST